MGCSGDAQHSQFKHCQSVSPNVFTEFNFSKPDNQVRSDQSGDVKQDLTCT